jgi:hypothetical protein
MNKTIFNCNMFFHIFHDTHSSNVNISIILMFNYIHSKGVGPIYIFNHLGFQNFRYAYILEFKKTQNPKLSCQSLMFSWWHNEYWHFSKLLELSWFIFGPIFFQLLIWCLCFVFNFQLNKFRFKFLKYIKRCIKNVGEKTKHENGIAIEDELIKKR